MNIPVKHLDTKQPQALFTGILESLPGQFGFGFGALHPPVAKIEKDAASQSIGLVRSARVTDGPVDKDGITSHIVK